MGKQTPKENSNAGLGSYKRLVIRDGDTVIDFNATAKTVTITGPAGFGSITMALTSSGTTGTGGKTVTLREVDICVGGVTQKTRSLLCDPYG